MVLPGIRALFEFQLIAVFNDGFSTKLSEGQQYLHFISILLTVIGGALVDGSGSASSSDRPIVSEQTLHSMSTTLLLLSMFPLAMSICLEIYLIAEIITKSARLGLLSAFLPFALFLYLWITLPRIERRRD
jgi:hypothetical protein